MVAAGGSGHLEEEGSIRTKASMQTRKIGTQRTVNGIVYTYSTLDLGFKDRDQV